MKYKTAFCVLVFLGICILLLQAAFGAAMGEKSGYVTTAHAGYSAELLREGWWGGVVRIKGAGQKVAVPVGTYRLVAWTVSATHEGKEWRISGAPGARGPRVEVTAGAVTALKFGPPLTAKVSAKKVPGAVLFDFSMTDSAGKTIGSSSIYEGGKRIGPPKIEIRNAEGKLMATGEFRYG